MVNIGVLEWPAGLEIERYTELAVKNDDFGARI